MADDIHGLSDRALSILAFAVYHRLVGGERVTAVIRSDGHGHTADPEGVAELEGRGLVTVAEGEIGLGETAQELVETMAAALRREVGQ